MSEKNLSKEDEGKLVYLAGPYTHDIQAVREIREKTLTLVSRLLLDFKVNNISPITHSAAQAKAIPVSGEYAAWKVIDRQYISRCDEIWVLDLEGWEQSVGVKDELIWAEELGLPRYLIHYSPITNKITKISLDK